VLSVRFARGNFAHRIQETIDVFLTPNFKFQALQISLPFRY
jgi:hypothetical protein